MSNQPELKLDYSLKPPPDTIAPIDKETSKPISTDWKLSVPVETVSHSSQAPSLSSLADSLDYIRPILFKSLSEWKDAIAKQGEELDSGAGREGGRSQNTAKLVSKQHGPDEEDDEDEVEDDDDDEEEE